LEPCPTYYFRVGVVRVRFQFEEIAEQTDRRGDSKESFTKVNKDGKLQNGVWIKMIHMDAIVMQQFMEKIRCR
jgi:hypothetical protein